MALALASTGCILHAPLRPEPLAPEPRVAAKPLPPLEPLVMDSFEIIAGKRQPDGLDAPPLVLIGDPLGLRIAARAEELLEQKHPNLVRRDCSGLIETVYRDLGLLLPELDVEGNSVKREYEGFGANQTVLHDRPLPGDLAFFDDTWDRNKNGKVDDPLTHVTIVTEIDVDGTVTMVHFARGHLSHLQMNLDQTHTFSVKGKRLNDYLRVARKRDQPGTHYLAGELYQGAGRLRVPMQLPVANR